MSGFFGKLFKRRSTQLHEHDKLLKNVPPEVRERFTVRPQADIVEGASGRFGYDKTNPIPVCQQAGEIEYLARLRCECGEPFMFHRIGSFGSGPDGHVIDGYELICRMRQHHMTLYMDMYHAGSSLRIPENLTHGAPEGIGLPIQVDDFPDGLFRTIDNIMKSRRK